MVSHNTCKYSKTGIMVGMDRILLKYIDVKHAIGSDPQHELP